MPRGYRPYAMDTMDGDPERWMTTSARGLDCSGWGKPEMRGSFKPPPDNGLPDWFSTQTAPRVQNPPTARMAIPDYCGYQPLVQAEISDEKSAKDREPKIRLHAPLVTSPPKLSKPELSLARASGMTSPSEIVVRPHHIKGYTGTLPGSMSQEFGKLKTVRTSEIAEELRKLSKGLNAKTFATYNVLERVPTKSINQETHPRYSFERQDKVGSRYRFIRRQSEETKYADTYSKSNAGRGPFQKRISE